MTVNRTDFSILKPHQDLFLVRYSQAPHPDYIVVKFKYYNKEKGIIEVEKTNTSGKKSIMTVGESKAIYRLFLSDMEMAKSLFECFTKRNMELPNEYKKLISDSQDIKPEIWV